jgi:hypothetical protein
MFNENYQGYYIHGKSPLGAADVSSEKLRLNLEAESQGEGAVRGIHPSMPNDQTFEIFLPAKMLNQYKQLYYNSIDNKINQTHIDSNLTPLE